MNSLPCAPRVRWSRLLALVGLTVGACSSGYAQQNQPAESAPTTSDKAVADADTGRGSRFESVVISATRTERKLSLIPVPITVITGVQIRQMGSARLSEVLSEATGAALLQDQFGLGLQLQGFDAAYTLILVDGEPLVGRTAGVLNLTRLTAHDIERIEVVKGPSSSLYGSEALGGVVNIITRQVSERLKLGARIRSGSNATHDLLLDGGGRRGKFWAQGLVNRYQTDGYDLQPEELGSTTGRVRNYTLQGKVGAEFNPRTRLSISGRYLHENQYSTFGSVSGLANITARVQEWTFVPTLVVQLRPSIRWRTSFYTTRYGSSEQWNLATDNSLVQADQFAQSFTRPEVQFDFGHGSRYVFTVGGGGTVESLNSSRYTGIKRFQSAYTYVQADASPVRWLNIVAGARFDAHSVYASQLSPKFAVRADLLRWLTFRGSLGAGFKAPDFRQLYLNFSNLGSNYSVYGTQEISAQLASLQTSSLLAQQFVDPSTLTDLKAERSWSAQAGFAITPHREVRVNVNAYLHRVANLIDAVVVASTTNSRQIFTYRNLGEIRLYGVEADATWQPIAGVQLSAGYQLLLSENADDVKAIDQATLFLATRKLTNSDYLGLFNRSRHMGTVKLFAQHPQYKTGLAARAILRGPYGLGDTNGNNVYDVEDAHVPGYVLLNLTLTQPLDAWLGIGLELQFGADNLLDRTDASRIPSLPGRLWFGAINYRFSTS